MTVWPWEHLAVGYLCYSCWCRVRGERPGDGDAVALAVATQGPDLVDKPLAWSVGVLPSGLSLGHSLLFAVPLCLGVVAVARAAGRRPLGDAVAVGYLSHPPADVLYHLATDGTLLVGFLVWPLVPAPAVSTRGLLSQAWLFLAEWLALLGSPRGRMLLLAELSLLGGATGVWTVDRFPGVGLVRDALRLVRRSLRGGRRGES